MTIVSHNLAGLQAHAEAAIRSEASLHAWQKGDIKLELREDAKAQLKQLGMAYSTAGLRPLGQKEPGEATLLSQQKLRCRHMH